MKRNLQLFNWTFIGIIIYSISQWLIVFVLNKNFDYESVGLYTLALAVVSPLFIFSFLQLRTVYITGILNNIELFVKLRIYLMVITLFILFLISYFNDVSYNYLIIILALSIVKVSEGISDIIYAVFHREQKMKPIAISIILRSILSVTIFILTYLLFNDFNKAFVIYAIFTFIFTFFYDVLYLYKYQAKLKFKRFKLSEYRMLFLVALPMGIVTFIASLSVNIPRYILEYRASIELLGIFASLLYLITIITKITTSLSQVLSPKLANAFNNRKYNLFKKISYTGLVLNIGIGFSLIVTILTLGDYLLPVIYTEDYLVYIDEFVYLSIYGLLTFIGGFLGNIITSMKVFKVQIYIHLFKMIIILVASLILIDNNLFGIITAMIIGSVFSIIVYGILIIWKFRKETNSND